MLNTQGLTYRQVKEYVRELADNIPALDTVCEEYTVRHTPAAIIEERKGVDRKYCPEEVFMTARIGSMRIELKVTCNIYGQEGGGQ